MDRLTSIQSCKECGKLLKQKELNEQQLCPKCLDKKAIDELNIAVPNLEPEQKDDSLVETPPTEPATQNELTDPTVETVEEADSDDGQPESQLESKAEVKIKPGQAIRDRFMQLVAEGKITDEVLQILTDKEATAKATGIRYAFLKEYHDNVSIKELTYINGAARYTSKPIVEINGKQYLVTNDLYAKTLPKFLEWAESLDGKAVEDAGK